MVQIGYLPEQNQILYDSERYFKQNEGVILIEGPSGCGKSFLAKEIEKGWNKSSSENTSFHISGDFSNSDRDYFPFLIGLTELKKTNSKITITKELSVETVKGIPYVGSLTSYVLNTVLKTGSSKQKEQLVFLNPLEQDILFRLQFFAKNKNTLLIIDNFHWFDINSIKLLNFICSERLKDIYPFLKQMRILVIYTKNQKNLNDKQLYEFLELYIQKTYTLNYLAFENYSETLQLFGLQKKINNSLLKVLYSITGGHLELIKNIVNYVNNNVLENVESTINNITSQHAEKILQERLKQYGVEGEQIKKLLEYASIIGISFSYDEIECLSKEKKENIEIILKKTNDLSLTEISSGRIYFAHEILKNIFSCKSKDIKLKNHKSFAECLRLIRPGDYTLRATHFFEAGEIKDSLIFYIVAYLKNFRDGLEFSPLYLNRINILAKDYELHEYFETIKNAYTLYNNREYGDAIKLLRNVEDSFHKILVVEKDYLLSLCLSKSLNNQEKNEAKNILEIWTDLNIRNNEGEIWTRVMSTLIILYVHLNHYDEAIKTEKRLMMYFNEREKFDPFIVDGINVLRRKSMALHSSEIACQRTKQSIEYFGAHDNSNIPLNPVQYYMSLSNHAGNLIIQGDFDNAYQYSLNAIHLINQFNYIQFPRPEIPTNNLIICGVLSGNITLRDSIDMYNQIFNTNLQFADNILLLNNQAIFYALSGEFIMAESKLNKALDLMSQNYCDDLFYEYYVKINLMAVKFLTDKKKDAFKIYKVLKNKIPNIPETDKIFLKRRHELLLKSLNADIQTSSGWDSYLLDNYQNELGKAWNFYGKGFLFSDIQFWSES